MRIKTVCTILMSMIVGCLFAQNEKPDREAYTLKLPVDGIQFYEQKLNKTPYFVHETTLQLYPGEKLWIEVEKNGTEITSMKVVQKNLNPEKTISVEFTQTAKNRKNEYMTLTVDNPFNKALEYTAMMYIVGQDKWINTNVYPVRAKMAGIEMWSDVIITLVLRDWKFK